MFIAQALSEPNPAAHAIWWVAGAIALVIGVFVLLEVVDFVRIRMKRSPNGDLSGVDPQDSGFRIDEPPSDFRQRHFRRPRAETKSWKEGLIEHDRDVGR